MCLSAGFHGEGARVLRRPMAASRALRWMDKEVPSPGSRSIILDTGGPSTWIEAHLTHQLRVRHEIFLK
jgi:hypothetical protein